MASIINHCKLNYLQQLPSKLSVFHLVKRGTAIPPKPKPKIGFTKHRNLIKSDEDALAARGFLRSQKPYVPPDDVVERVKAIFSKTIDSPRSDAKLSCQDKFKVLVACFEEFKHSVPNSALHKINTCMDILDFYTTTVSTTTPLDEFKNKELPPNLHIQYDYVRFHPETDTMFNGVTAFNNSSTIVTSLKFKDKYKGHRQKLPHYYDNWSDYIKHDEYKS